MLPAERREPSLLLQLCQVENRAVRTEHVAVRRGWWNAKQGPAPPAPITDQSRGENGRPALPRTHVSTLTGGGRQVS